MGNNWKDKLKVTTITDTEQVEIYREYINQQRKEFENFIEFFNRILFVLKMNGFLSDFTRFIARIKSTESAIQNDGKKALDDSFGIEVDTATSGEATFLAVFFKMIMEKTKESVKNKENGYIAHHLSGFPNFGDIGEGLENILTSNFDLEIMFEEYMKDLPQKSSEKIKNSEYETGKTKDYFTSFCSNLNSYIDNINLMINPQKLEHIKKVLKYYQQEYNKKYQREDKDSEIVSKSYIPIIEGQFKKIGTAIEANNGTAHHGRYKGESTEDIQEEYDKKGGIPLSRIPVMWKSNIQTDGNGNLVPPTLLSSVETAKILYPDLVLWHSFENELQDAEIFDDEEDRNE